MEPKGNMVASAFSSLKDPIDLTLSDTDNSDLIITRTPHRSQPQSQPSSRSHKPISPPAVNHLAADPLQSNGTSITATPALSTAPSQASPSRPMKQHTQESPSSKVTSISVKPLVKISHDAPQSATPPSAKKHADHHKTPKNQTPKKVEWSVQKIEEKLQTFALDIGQDAARLTSYLVDKSWKSKTGERRFISKKDHFAGIRPESSQSPPEFLKMKTKVRLL